MLSMSIKSGPTGEASCLGHYVDGKTGYSALLWIGLLAAMVYRCRIDSCIADLAVDRVASSRRTSRDSKLWCSML